MKGLANFNAEKQRRGGAEAAEEVRCGHVTLRNILTNSFSGEWGDECKSDDGVLVLRTVNFTNEGNISYVKTVRRSITASKVEAKKLLFGDIIVEKSGGTKDNPVGRVVFFDCTDQVYLTNNFTHVLRPDKTLVFPRYLLYVLLAFYKMKVTESLYNKTTGIQNLQINKYLDLQLPLPPLPEQKRIAATLDRICELKKNSEVRLAKLDLLVKSRFVEMFGDVLSCTEQFETAKVENVADVGSSRRIFQNEYVSQGIPFYRTKEIVELSHGKPITTELYISHERYAVIKEQYGVPKKGDLLISAVGTIGEIWIVDGRDEFYFKDGNLMQIRPGEQLDSIYLRQCLNVLIKHFKRMIPSGTAYAALTIDSVKKMVIPVPPLALQREFAAFVEKVEKLKDDARRSAERLDVLYRSKLQEYFGEADNR
jgi:type I restriction enzyme S subunit